MVRFRTALLSVALAALGLPEKAVSRPPALVDSLAVGLWRMDSPRPESGSDAVHLSRLTLYLSPDHSWESMLWVVDRTGPQPDYIGIRATGTWSLEDAAVALKALECTGFTASGRTECAQESDEIGDTDYFGVLGTPAGKRLAAQEPTSPLTLPFAGKTRDMGPPEYWPVALSLDRKPRLPPNGLVGEAPSSVIDILGRQGPGTAAGMRYPVRTSPKPSPI